MMWSCEVSTENAGVVMKRADRRISIKDTSLGMSLPSSLRVVCYA